jgi:hypothetical protein
MDAQGMTGRTALRARLDAARTSNIHWWLSHDWDIHRRQSYTHGLGAVECIHLVRARDVAGIGAPAGSCSSASVYPARLR